VLVRKDGVGAAFWPHAGVSPQKRPAASSTAEAAEQFIGEVGPGRELYLELGVFAVAVLERHLQSRILAAAALG